MKLILKLVKLRRFSIYFRSLYGARWTEVFQKLLYYDHLKFLSWLNLFCFKRKTNYLPYCKSILTAEWLAASLDRRQCRQQVTSRSSAPYSLLPMWLLSSGFKNRLLERFFSNFWKRPAGFSGHKALRGQNNQDHSHLSSFHHNLKGFQSSSSDKNQELLFVFFVYLHQWHWRIR